MVEVKGFAPTNSNNLCSVYITMTHSDHFYHWSCTVLQSLISRREALAALASSAAVPLLFACSRDQGHSEKAGPTEADALALLDEIANNLLRLYPESATSL